MIDLEVKELKQRNYNQIRELIRISFGLGVNLTSPSLFKDSLKIINIILTISSILSMYGNWCYITRNLEDLSKIAESVCTALQTIVSIVKMIYYVFIQRKLYVLLSQAQAHENITNSEVFQKDLIVSKKLKRTIHYIMENSWKDIRRQLIFYICSCGAITSNYFFVALFVNMYHDIKDTPNYNPKLPDLHGMSQQTVGRIIKKVAKQIALLLPNFIKFPCNAEIVEVKSQFYQLARFPNVVGAIDCTHVRIKCPAKKVGRDLAGHYINRIGYYSLNVQIVCDADCKITDIVARSRGSKHDSRIWSECKLKAKLELNKRYHNGVLLGDAGYPLSTILLTPIRNPSTAKEENYNKCHIATRSKIECLNGQLKSKFRSIFERLRVDLDTAKNVIVSVAVLHNIAKERNSSSFPSVYPIWEHKGMSFPYYHIQMYLGGCADYIAGICAASFDGVFIVLCVHGVGLIQVLNAMVENSTSPEVPKARRVEYLRYCIFTYQRIYNYVLTVDNIYRHISLSQFLLSLLIWGIVLFQMSISLGSDKITMARMVLYILAAGFEIIIYCYNSQRLSNELEKTPLAFYSCEWFNESEKFKQLIRMMILRTNRIFNLNISWFTTMSLPTLLAMVKTSGSYFLLLRNLAE